MRGYIRYLYVAVVLLLSCRQPLVDEVPNCDSAVVSVAIDWSLSLMDSDDVESLSLYAYPDSGGAPYLKISTDIDSLAITLPVGSYSLVAMNDVVIDIVGVNFTDVDSYADFSANVIADDSGEITTHGQVAVARQQITITEDMVWCQYCEADDFIGEELSLSLQMTPVTALCTVQIAIDNLDNAQSIEATLTGGADGAILSTNSRIDSESEVNYYLLQFTSRTYDEESNSTNGVTITQIVTFGKSSDNDATYQLEIDIILNTGEMASYTRDVTSQVTISDDFNIFIDLTDSTSTITLPESSGTGFGVEAWGDSEQVGLI